MDWIEQWFGIAPDGGDGSIEILAAIAAVLVLFGLLVHRKMPKFLKGVPLKSGGPS